MPRQLTTPDRVMLLMSLIPYLLEHGPTPLQELAEAFDVDPRVLRRLVRFLGVAGVPGETLTYQHEDLFDIDWDALEQHDVVSLTRVVAVEDTPRFSSSETAALVAGLHALAPMLPESMRDIAAATAEKLASVERVDARRQTVSVTADPTEDRMASIIGAIEARARLCFDYRDAEGRHTVRTIDPLLLWQSGGSWYLRGWCIDRAAERTFLVDRIRDPRAIAEGATAVLAGKQNSLPVVSGTEITATLAVRLDALQRIADFTPRVLGEPASGWLRVEVDLLHPAVAVRIVQAAPGKVIVEGPAEARDSVEQWAARALAQYDA